MPNYQTFLALILLVFLVINCRERQDQFGFSAGVLPIEYGTDFQTSLKQSRESISTSKQCGACHSTVYQNWLGSRHRVAFSNRLYQEAHAREPLDWCVNCHAPFMKPGGNPTLKADRVQAEDGISCITCHVRQGRIMVSQAPAKAKEHSYLVKEDMATEKFCASCHQFNFPSRASMAANAKGQGVIEYSHLVMQDTVNEYRRSGFYNKLTCNSCHLLANTEESHRFAGGHDLEWLKQSLHLRARRLSRQRVAIQIYAVGIGHSFPTGDLFRSLRLYLSSKNGQENEQIILHKMYKNIHPRNASTDGPAKYLAKDTTIPPPAANEYTSMREFVIDWQSRGAIVYSLHIDYLFGFNHVTTSLDDNKTAPLIKQGFLHIN